jgi:hypothetical protein
MPCIILLLTHIWLIYLLGHMYVYLDLELEELTEQVQDEDFTNLALDQGKPRCFEQCSLSFILNLS